MFEYLYDRIRRITPYRIRAGLKNQCWFNPLLQGLLGSSVYSASYYRDIERIEGASTNDVAEWLIANLQPASVLDVGCGPGHFMDALAKRGIKVMGIDYSRAARMAVQGKGLPFRQIDLRSAEPLPRGDFDLIFCTEVAEHLEPKYADVLVNTLTSFSAPIFLTAADNDPLAGPGLLHFNEQPREYWIDLMLQHGFTLDFGPDRSGTQCIPK